MLTCSGLVSASLSGGFLRPEWAKTQIYACNSGRSAIDLAGHRADFERERDRADKLFGMPARIAIRLSAL
jgi:hypothetical protein